MKKTTTEDTTVSEAYKKISMHVKRYNPIIDHIKIQRPDLLEKILNEEVNSSIITQLYRDFKKDTREINLVNNFYEKLQSFYNQKTL